MSELNNTGLGYKSMGAFSILLDPLFISLALTDDQNDYLLAADIFPSGLGLIPFRITKLIEISLNEKWVLWEFSH